mgnify:CR=1 FL=1
MEGKWNSLSPSVEGMGNKAYARTVNAQSTTVRPKTYHTKSMSILPVTDDLYRKARVSSFIIIILIVNIPYIYIPSIYDRIFVIVVLY